jgi:hypothetical protein
MKCSRHPRYMGRKKPRDCDTCSKIWNWSRFATYAMNNHIEPEDLCEETIMIGIRNHFATLRLSYSIEKDMFGGNK